MLATNEKRLRWLGLDMRPRWRRRAAVLVAYTGFMGLLAIWANDSWGPKLLAHPFWASTIMIVACGYGGLSVFRVVKSFEDAPVVAPKQKQTTVRVNGLDEWARYRYGVASFEEASEEQQAELLKRYRVGTYIMPAKVVAKAAKSELDEREVKERDTAERWALRQLPLYLWIETVRYLREAAAHKQVEPLDAAVDLWAFWLLATTLPAARVLWTEADPREVGGEMALVAVESEV